MSDPGPTAPGSSSTGTILGWVAGTLALLLVNFVLFHSIGERYPVMPTSFGAVVLGAFGGMALADRLGPRAVRVLGLALGVLLAATTVAAFVVFGS